MSVDLYRMCYYSMSEQWACSNMMDDQQLYMSIIEDVNKYDAFPWRCAMKIFTLCLPIICEFDMSSTGDYHWIYIDSSACS